MLEFEVGFRLVSYLVKSVGLPFAAFNVLYVAVYIALFFLSFKRENFEISGWLVLQLFSPFLFGLMGTTRQAMAIAICMFSVKYLLNHNWMKFLLCVAAASTFHISALAFLIALPVSHIRLNNKRIWIVFVALIIASLSNVGSIAFKAAEERVAILRLADLENRLVLEQEATPEQFNNAAGSVANIVQMSGRLALLLLFILCFNSYTEESDQLYFKFYLVSIIIVVLLSGTVFVLAQRIALYFSIFQIHLLALLTRRIRIPALRQLACCALLLLSLSRLWTAVYLIRPRIFVPYKGVFINQDVRRDPGWF